MEMAKLCILNVGGSGKYTCQGKINRAWCEDWNFDINEYARCTACNAKAYAYLRSGYNFAGCDTCNYTVRSNNGAFVCRNHFPADCWDHLSLGQIGRACNREITCSMCNGEFSLFDCNNCTGLGEIVCGGCTGADLGTSMTHCEHQNTIVPHYYCVREML